MSIIGFNFTKILVEKKTVQKTGKVEVKNNVAITQVVESGLNISNDKQTALKFEFEFESKYTPDFGIIRLEGNLISLENKEESEKLIAEWKETKKLNHPMIKNILNSILAKANVEALILSREVNLPSPIPLPKVNVKE